MHKPIKVAITDDHPLMVDALKNIIQKNEDLLLVGAFYNGKSSLEAIHSKLSVDIWLMDLSLPDNTGEEILQKAEEQKFKTSFIIITTFDDTTHLKKLMGLGAKGYLIKSAEEELILEAIQKVASGEEYIQQCLKDKLIEESLRVKKEMGYMPKLTRREKEVLKLIVNEQTTQEIADHLFISPKTVETHRLNLMQKLNVKNMAGLVRVTLEYKLV